MIKTLVYTVSAISIFSVLAEVIMPSGKMNKYVKSTISLILTLYVISPVLGAIKLTSKMKFDDELSIETDEYFIKKADYARILLIEEDVSAKLYNAFSIVTDVNVNVLNDKISMTIYVKTVLNDTLSHTYIADDIRVFLCKEYDVKKENIFVYGLE